MSLIENTMVHILETEIIELRQTIADRDGIIERLEADGVNLRRSKAIAERQNREKDEEISRLKSDISQKDREIEGARKLLKAQKGES
jgi:predicted RNase H-like nuclease (RuvC/YqgF family)